MPRRTLARTVDLTGTGLHTGANTTVQLAPAESGTGIRFRRDDLPNQPLIAARLGQVRATSDKLDYDDSKETAHFVGRVHATKGAMRLEASDMLAKVVGGQVSDITAQGSVLVTAEQEGKVRGVLQFVPWGEHGLSMDVMRRDRAADNGVNELMISELLLNARDHGIQSVSLNFAAFRAVLEQGRRIGAGPVARMSAKVLGMVSKWIQIETLYRFNAKFQPRWVPRYLVYPGVRDLPHVGDPDTLRLAHRTLHRQVTQNRSA